MPSLLPEVVLKLPLTAMSVTVAAVGASCGRFFESAKAVLSALGVVASTTTQSKGGTTNMSLLPKDFVIKRLGKIYLVASIRQLGSDGTISTCGQRNVEVARFYIV